MTLTSERIAELLGKIHTVFPDNQVDSDDFSAGVEVAPLTHSELRALLTLAQETQEQSHRSTETEVVTLQDGRQVKVLCPPNIHGRVAFRNVATNRLGYMNARVFEDFIVRPTEASTLRESRTVQPETASGIKTTRIPISDELRSAIGASYERGKASKPKPTQSA